jgi:serine/threonine protein kinase
MTQDYLIGMQLDEYRLESLLGRGGMARVYRAVDVNLNRAAAIKVIDIPHRADGEYVQRFKREALAIAQLDHPHIVRLYRYGEVQTGPEGDSVLYMAMQFIEGSDLQFVLRSYRKDGELIEWEEAVRIIREVCSALDAAHSRGIIHRDVKPSNIMLDTRARAILTDFGLAMLSTQATRGEVFGSPAYIPPEQAVSSAKAVPQSDLYSVGVILYEMLTGVLPFTAAEPLELALMHMNQPVPSPRKIRPEISEELEAVMLKALSKQPEDRFSNGLALADALEAAVSGIHEPVPAAHLSILERVTIAWTVKGVPPQKATSAPMNDGGTDTIRGADIEGAANYLPGPDTPLRPALLPTILPTQQASSEPTVQPDSGAFPPAAGRTGRKKWLYGLTGILTALFLVFLCIGGSGVFLFNRLISGRNENPTADSQVENSPTPSFGISWSATATSEPTDIPTQTAQAASPGSGPYQILINRKGEDQGYILLTNLGSTAIPLAELTLRVEKRQVSAEAWGIEQLPSGACVLAWKDEKGNSDVIGSTCQQSGKTLTFTKKLEEVFKGKLDIYWGDEKIGSCAKEESPCQISFSD